MAVLRTQIGRVAMEAGAAQAFGGFLKAGKASAEGEAKVAEAEGRRDKSYGDFLNRVYDAADKKAKGSKLTDQEKEDAALVDGLNTYRAYSSHFNQAPQPPGWN